MQRRLQWVLLLLAALLVIVIVRTWRDGRAEPEATGARFLERGDEAAVTAIELRQDRARLRIERREDEWRLRAPLADLASRRMVGELLRALTTLEVLRRIESDSLARYDLDPPRARLILERGEAPALELLLGASAPASGHVYATWSGLGGIAIVPRFLVEQFFGSELYYWREREILPPARAAIDSVWVEAGGDRLRARRRAQEDWVFLEPADREADPISLERAVAAFWRFSYTEFFDAPGAVAELGLADPRATWVLFRGGRRDTLRIGRRLEGHALAVRAGGRPPGSIRDDLDDFLTGGVAALEVRRPLAGDPQRIDRIVLAGAGKGAALAKRGDDWFWMPLDAAQVAACEAGGAPPEVAEGGARVSDPAIDQDLRNLFEMSGERWAAPLERDPDPRDFALRMQLWSDSGARAWAYFAPGAGCAAAPDSDRAAAFSGLAVGSRFPRRPLCLTSDAVWRWQVRLRNAP